jgi:DNA-binding Xre family transcriptional regulator
MNIQTRELIVDRGFVTAYEFAKASGLGIETAYRAMGNRIKEFRPKTIEALCATLFCTPNQIFGYDADEPMNFPPNAEEELPHDVLKRLSAKAYEDYRNRRNKYKREEAKTINP